MDWLLNLDVALFRFLNGSLINPAFDWLMPQLAAQRAFIPLVLLAGGWLAWKGGPRGRVFLLLMALTVLVTDGILCNSLKHLIGRPRPFATLENVHLLVGKGGSGSMPSSHTANWFAAAMVLWVYYRRVAWIVLPFAAVMGFSRIYLGVHYPSDVLVGAVLGAGSAAGVVMGSAALWNWAGRKWFNQAWQRLPNLLNPILKPAPVGNAPAAESRSGREIPWLRSGYVLIGVLLLVRLAYLAAGKIGLSEDEAYQWLWSKHLDWSYYSKPPLIAVAQFLGTSLWGDNAFGVRFLSPVLGALTGLLVLRFAAREANPKIGFLAVVTLATAPILAAGSVLMTIDPLSVLFWTAAMICGWNAIQRDSLASWLWCGLWMGMGFLSKYVALFQWLSWAVLFALWPKARAQLRRPGPWLAIVVNVLCSAPVIWWNWRNGWPTVTHLYERGGMHIPWKFTLKYFGEFLGAELGLLNPVFFLGAMAAMVLFWRRRDRTPLEVFLFAMGAPLFLFYLAYTFRARVQPNWIAPAIVPLFLLMVIYWERAAREGARWVAPWFKGAVIVAIPLIIVLHDTNLVGKISGMPLPDKLDPLRRVRSGPGLAEIAETELQKLRAEGKPAFIIGAHYGITGLVSFYHPESRATVQGDALAYFQSSDRPLNQFYFWPSYAHRKGQNAIYITHISVPFPPPPSITAEFESVEDLGTRDVLYRGRVMRTVRVFACRNLR